MFFRKCYPRLNSAGRYILYGFSKGLEFGVEESVVQFHRDALKEEGLIARLPRLALPTAVRAAATITGSREASFVFIFNLHY
jgi:hypothetical protein